MNWNIQKFIACPDTGTMYSLAVSAKNLQMILWCKGDYFLRQGSVMDSTPFGMVVNGKVRKIQVLHAFPYSLSLWDYFKERTLCPGNEMPEIRRCPRQTVCAFELCPYGAQET